jgi:hypothetical protein
MFLNLFLPCPGVDSTKPFYPTMSWQEFVPQQPDWFPRSSQEPLIAHTVPYALTQLHVSSILFNLHDYWRIYWLFRNVGNQVDCVWNVMAHTQKPDFVFRRNGRVHLNRRGLQFSRLLAREVCASAVVMLDTPCSEIVWRVLVTHSIRQFPLHFPSLRHRVPSCFNCTLPTTQRNIPKERRPQHFRYLQIVQPRHLMQWEEK